MDYCRLWCICRQPHNNRFMICCDKCEDWFHGKCVNITKSMGNDMEARNIEWVCPNCKNKQQPSVKVSNCSFMRFSLRTIICDVIYSIQSTGYVQQNAQIGRCFANVANDKMQSMREAQTAGLDLLQ